VKIWIYCVTLPKSLKMSSNEFEVGGKNQNKRKEKKKEKNVKVACMLKSNIMDFTDRIGSWPEKPLIFFLLSFLNCDTHPDLATVA